MTSIPSRYLWTSCLGNLFEHYDTALFGLLSPILAPLIFPDKDPLTALILTYAIIPLGMLARPIGSLVFGYIGDVYGRTHALFWTLAGMSIVSGCIALSPTYQQVGLWAPIIFCVGRALQNFLSGGEVIGGAIFLLENSSDQKRDLFSSLYSASTMSGHLFASWGVFAIIQYNYTDPGWRLLYVVGCITALFGCLIRRTAQDSQPPIKTSHRFAHLKTTLWAHRMPLLFIVVTSGFASATYSMALVMMNGLVPLISTVTKAEIMKVNTYLLILDICALPFFGWAASKIGREKLMLTASVCAAAFAIPLVSILQGASLAYIVGVRAVFVIIGVAFFAPFHAWAQRLIPYKSRYTVISFGYAVGSQVLGSPAAAIALWSFQKTGMIESIVIYWMTLALVSTVIIGSILISQAKPQRLKEELI